MILPAIYAVLVWYLAMRYRRQWQGLAIVVLGVALLAAINHLFRADRWYAEDKHASLLLILLWPYTILIAVGGLFIVSLPRRPPGEYHCARCFYDFRGLDPDHLVCPECGEPWKGRGWNPREPEPELIKPPPRRVPRSD